MKSSLHLHDVRLMMRIGHLDDERAEPQAMRLDIDIYFSKPLVAFDNDELSSGICYDALLSDVSEFCEKSAFKLIEYCAKRIYENIKTKVSDTDRVSVSVTKLHPPIDCLHGGARCSYGD